MSAIAMKSTAGTKRAACDRENGDGLVPSACRRRRTEESSADLITTPPAPTTSERQKTESALVLTSPAPVRSYPPSPLRYQISETPAATPPFILPNTPTQHRYRGKTSKPLIKEVFGPVVQPLPEFKYSEDEIEIISVFANGKHSMVYKISAGGKFHLLKIHVYDRHITPNTKPLCPHPNHYYTAEYNAYGKLTGHPAIHGSLTPKCHGYINLRQMPMSPEYAAQGLPIRRALTCSKGVPALYKDFITQKPGKNHLRSSSGWLAYFRNAPPGAVILRGLVLSELPLQIIKQQDFSDPSKAMCRVVRAGKEQLKALHACGILHGDVEGVGNVLFTRAEGGNGTMEGRTIRLLGFGQALTAREPKSKAFRRLRKQEIRTWEGKWACMIVDQGKLRDLEGERVAKQ